MPTFPVIAHINCIVIEGADARRFAQAQFSADVDALAPDHWQWNAWLTPQGRVRALMHLVDAGGGRLLGVLRGGDAPAIHGELGRYLLRAKASLRLQTLSARASGPLPSGTVQRDAENMALGFGSRSLWLASADAAAVIDASANMAWRFADIQAGWANLSSDAQSAFLPPALGLEHLAAVSFDKGCYPGQEIAARLHYRGGHKRQLCHLSGASPLPCGDILASAAGGLQASILDTVAGPVGFDSLAVVDAGIESEINVLGSVYTINRKFDS